jgi:putative salt-induced outer membrane protein YdiY
MNRVENTLVGISGFGTSLDDWVLRRSKTKSIAVENYFLSTRYDHRLGANGKWYWFGETSWEQNQPAGLNSRTAFRAGMGQIFLSTDKSSWRVDAGLGATREIPIIPRAGFKKYFGTANLTSSLRHKFNDNVNYNADLTCTYNIRIMRDRVYVLRQKLQVTMTRRTSLSIGYDMNYRNNPAQISVRVYTEDYPPIHIGNIITKAKKLDVLATTSLVFTL